MLRYILSCFLLTLLTSCSESPPPAPGSSRDTQQSRHGQQFENLVAGDDSERSEQTPSEPLGDHFETPIPINIAGRVLELTDRTDTFAAPTLGDWDGDGRRDLLIGQKSGRMRVFRNLGTDERPEFSDPVWFDEIVADGRIPVG